MQFARLYLLNQLDLPVEKKHVDLEPHSGSGVKVENPAHGSSLQVSTAARDNVVYVQPEL